MTTVRDFKDEPEAWFDLNWEDMTAAEQALWTTLGLNEAMWADEDAEPEILEKDWERMVAFYDFPKEHWKHLRTTNVVESPFAAVRLRTDAAKRFKKTENATAMIWRLLLVAEKRFRKIDAPHLAAEIYRGVVFEDGVKITKSNQKAAA